MYSWIEYIISYISDNINFHILSVSVQYNRQEPLLLIWLNLYPGMGYIHCEVLDDITNLFPNVIDATATVGEWIEGNFIPHFVRHVIS